MFKSLFGRGAQNLLEMPPHIQEVDHEVCIAPPDIRATLIKFYTQSGTLQDKAIAFGLDRRTMMRRVEKAEWHMNSALDSLPTEAVVSRQNAVSHRNGPDPRPARQPIIVIRSPLHEYSE
jgi:hypothetical protein